MCECVHTCADMCVKCVCIVWWRGVGDELEPDKTPPLLEVNSNHIVPGSHLPLGL